MLNNKTKRVEADKKSDAYFIAAGIQLLYSKCGPNSL